MARLPMATVESLEQEIAYFEWELEKLLTQTRTVCEERRQEKLETTSRWLHDLREQRDEVRA